jgi:hypothetical protein
MRLLAEHSACEVNLWLYSDLTFPPLVFLVDQCFSPLLICISFSYIRNAMSCDQVCEPNFAALFLRYGFDSSKISTPEPVIADNVLIP